MKLRAPKKITRRIARVRGIPTPIEFLAKLKWLDGRPLLSTIEPYRRDTFMRVLYGFDANGRPRYNMALIGRAKKNNKTTDLILAALYRLLVWPSPAGNDCFILANDEQQAGDDLSLAKKLIAVNPVLANEVTVKAKSIDRIDGKGALTILPAGDVPGAHGKTFLFIGFDEIHGYRTHDLFEALAPDPTRPDVLTWITSYAGIVHAPGVPLYDFLQSGRRGDDPRMYFSWYASDFGTDPTFNQLETPEQRANPSMASWPDAEGYLAQQKKRLPSNKYRRLHLNLPGAPSGAAFSGEHVMAAIIPGRRALPYDSRCRYTAFVDMSGGSNDDAVLAIAHKQDERLILDLIASQSGMPPFNPRAAVAKFAAILRDYRINLVIGDAYGGQTFRQDFQTYGVTYQVMTWNSASDLFEDFEPRLTASEVELLDVPKLQEQLLTLIWRGNKITHQSGDHDDFANAACGALLLAVARQGFVISPKALQWAQGRSPAVSPFRFSAPPRVASSQEVQDFNQRAAYSDSVSMSDLAERDK
ncbi:MAG TPA: hypothetical protein VG328_07370 [Stellaceae bacterium]|nr:hypothetical protein [Stellaceae bacterium]